MGLLRRIGGIADVIRCDENSYIIWKWKPNNDEDKGDKRENAIRNGSILRVKEGEIAVVVYNNGLEQVREIVEGPFDKKLETKNLPVVANIIGRFYNGESPSQAEVYFINASETIQFLFGIPYFDIFDSRFPELGIPTAVRGKASFNIVDYHDFLFYHQLKSISIEDLKNEIKDAVIRYLKETIINLPKKHNIPVVQIEGSLSKINELVETELREYLKNKYGINLTAIDISAIDIDKNSNEYEELRSITQGVSSSMIRAETESNIRDIYDRQRINSENMAETLRIQREEAQYAQRKKTEKEFLNEYIIEKQAEVGVAGANVLGKIGDTSGFNNGVGLFAGMKVGEAVGENITKIMNSIPDNKEDIEKKD